MKTELAREHLAEYLSFRVVHAPRTLIRGIYQLQAAHWLRLKEEHVHQERYWHPTYAPPQQQRPAEGAVLDMLEENSNKVWPYVLSAMSRQDFTFFQGASAPPQSPLLREIFTSCFRALPSDLMTILTRNLLAGRVARLLNIEHHGFTVGTHQVAGAVDATVRALGNPNGNPAAILQYLLAEQSSNHAEIILSSGDGSVELLVAECSITWAARYVSQRP